MPDVHLGPDGRCDHSMLPGQCDFCWPALPTGRPPGLVRPQDLGTVPPGTETAERWESLQDTAENDSGFGPWFPAKFDSTCPSCGESISEGDQIRADDELGDFVCTNCGSKPRSWG